MFDWSKFCTHTIDVGGLPAISKITVPVDPYNAENQITEGDDEHSIAFFKQFHLPMIRMAGIEPNGCRVLEIGGGFGQLAYGTLKSIEPAAYLATDVFPALVKILDRNLNRWATGSTSVAAALCDPQRPLFVKEGVFDVIHSHSVLHHVLDYRAAVAELFEKLAKPGVMIFTEPCLESYMFLVMLLKLFRKARAFPDELALQVDLLTTYVEQRSGNLRTDQNFLAGFGAGDKYLYSAYDLFSLADHVGAKLHVVKDNRSPRGNLLFELKIRGADEETLAAFDEFLQGTLPLGMENAYFSDLRQIFCLVKQTDRPRRLLQGLFERRSRWGSSSR